MEEADDGQCSVVYFCPGSDNEISELYHPSSPPVIAPRDRTQHPSLANVHNNVRRLLDVDQGNFRQGRSLFVPISDLILTARSFCQFSI